MISSPLRCDIFCTVIDNFGDAAVSWRLARQLATEYGWQVRLWIDDPAVLQKLVPNLEAEPVQVCRWNRAEALVVDRVAHVVIEAFACDLPDVYVKAMAAQEHAPTWLNLEYLSAEFWVDDCHGMASNHPQLPLNKHFFFPGFSDKTGGLLLEADYTQRLAVFDESEFRREFQLPVRQAGELTVSMFSYPNPALATLLDAWQAGDVPIHLLWPGRSDPTEHRGQLHIHPLPFLPQNRYDELLWACDLNLVRGEDSFVRAQWAGKPFVWHIYPQADDTHRIKLDAFLQRIAKVGNDGTAMTNFWHAWNGWSTINWPEFSADLARQKLLCTAWRDQLATRTDLAAQLVNFCRQRLK
jgi:uncharacterized repeat protein (TIGR03837 family)